MSNMAKNAIKGGAGFASYTIVSKGTSSSPAVPLIKNDAPINETIKTVVSMTDNPFLRKKYDNTAVNRGPKLFAIEIYTNGRYLTAV